MKIVMLCDLYDGAAQYRENLIAKYYVRNGHEVIVIASTFDRAIEYVAMRYDRQGPAREYSDGGVRVIKLPYALNLLNRLRRFAGVAAILERERPDVITAGDVHLNLAEAVAYKRRHPACRIVMDCSADFTNSAKNWLSLHVLNGGIRRWLLQRWLPHIDQVFAVTPGTITFLEEAYGVPRDRIELLPLGVDTVLAREVARSDARAEVRRALGIPHDALVAFTGGKLVPLKRTDVLVDAVASISPADAEVHAIVVGTAATGAEAYAEALETAGQASGRVHFVGWREAAEVYRYMAACDLAVFPASQSALWQQALSMGLPLIVGRATTRGDQDPSYLNAYGALIILPFEDIRADVVADHLRRLAADRVTLDAMKAQALQTTDEMLDYDKLIERVLSA